MGVSLVGCATPKEGKTVTKSSDPIVEKNETINKLQLIKTSSTGTVTLISQLDELFTEGVVIESSI